MWSVLLFSSQLVAVLQPLFPYDAQNRAACYIFEDLEALLDEIQLQTLSFSPSTTDEDLLRLIKFSRAHYAKILSRFSKPDTFPHNEQLMKAAEEEANLYFRR